MFLEDNLMVKLIATDVDGTLLKDGTFDIDPAYDEIFAQLMDEGIKVVIASGRQYKSSMRLFPNTGSRLDYIADGGATYRLDGRTNAYQQIPRDMVEGILADLAGLKDAQIDVSLNSSELCYVPNQGSPMHLWLRDSYRFDIAAMDAPNTCPDDQIIKIAVYHPTSAETALPKEFYDKWGDKLHISPAGNQWVDMVMPGVNKGTALARIEELTGISPEETVVFGDNLNDLEMGAGAGRFYCVGNARDEVKALAHEVLEPYWQMGVLNKLKETLFEVRRKR